MQGSQVMIEINKADGERVQFEKTIDKNGCADIVQGTFQVYKEQPVNVIARIVSLNIQEGRYDIQYEGGLVSPDKYRVYSNKQTLLWEQIRSKVDFGGTYYWNPVINVSIDFSPAYSSS